MPDIIVFDKVGNLFVGILKINQRLSHQTFFVNGLVKAFNLAVNGINNPG